MNTAFVFGEHTLTFDIDEYEDARKYNEAVNEVLKAKGPARELNQQGYILAYCNTIRKFFDIIFGDGTSLKLLGESRNKREHDEAYIAFLHFVNAQVQESNLRVKTALERYAPSDGDGE